MSRKLTEKFTERAKLALNVAAKEAKSQGNNVIDTEHLLFGILADEASIAAKVLSSFHVDSEKVRESILSSSDSKRNKRGDGFSESCQETIAAAALQAYLWGSSYVGTEHLLCGLAKTPSGLAYHILRSWGITYEGLKSKVENYTTVQDTTATKEASTPLLNTYGSDITDLAKAGSLDPVIKREVETSRVLQVLARRTKNNPVLIGEAGVGKTAIVEGLAQRIVDKTIPKKFIDTRVISLDINALVAGTRFRGDFEERLLGIIDEIKDAENIILFIDEIQTIVGAGGASGALDAANILKPALSRGELRFIGATTAEEYSGFIEEDSALERRFQPIYIDEPDEKTALNIMMGLKKRYESYHGVRFTKEAVKLSVKLAKRYIVERHLPDSAIDILDEAASKKSVSFEKLSPTAIKIGDKLEEIQTEKDKLVKHEDWEGALDLREVEKKYSAKLGELMNKQESPVSTEVTENDVAQVVTMLTSIPVEELTRTEAQRLLTLEKKLSRVVIGQPEALKQVSSVLRRNRVGLRDPSRPIGSFIFLGTSGVGKTLVAETLAEVLFGGSENLIRLDMSEFSERHTVSRLVGAPPGYIGYEEGGELTDKLRHKPFSVVLLDEIEKAHPEVFNTLLQVLDNGQLVDGKGRTVNFRSSLIIMTSNVGSHLIRREGDIGFISEVKNKKDERTEHKNISDKLLEELRRAFRVEFLNRVDSTIVFNHLTKGMARKISKRLVKDVIDRLKAEHDMMLEVNEKVYDFLVERGFSSEYGAREMRRSVTETIEDPLSEKILTGDLEKGQTVSVKVEKGTIVLK